jgi:hypothetical protein
MVGLKSIYQEEVDVERGNVEFRIHGNICISPLFSDHVDFHIMTIISSFFIKNLMPDPSFN